MKKFLCVICLFATGQMVMANGFNTFETKQEAYDRQSQQNYNTYKNNNYQAPLGGYRETLGGSRGHQYGYNQNYNHQTNSYDSYNSRRNYNRY